MEEGLHAGNWHVQLKGWQVRKTPVKLRPLNNAGSSESAAARGSQPAAIVAALAGNEGS